MNTNKLYDAACDVEDFDLRVQLNSIIDEAWDGANESIYGTADKDSAGIVTDKAWERSAASCLRNLLRDASPDVVAWFNKMGFSWIE